jgi:8-oxo-dGTP diphosphatase
LRGTAFDDDCPGGPPPLGDRPLVLVAAVALVDRDGRVLIAQRPEGKSMAGVLELPGG